MDTNAQECKYVYEDGKRVERFILINGAPFGVFSMEKTKQITKDLTLVKTLQKKNKLLQDKLELKILQEKILNDRINTLMLVKIPEPDKDIKFFKSPYTTFIMGAVFTGVMFGYWACTQGDKTCIQR